MSTALYIGRFQPFHLGHLDAIKQVLKKEKHLIIGVGSADDNYLPDNPFTSGERITMIKKALDEAKIPPTKYMIMPVPNINNYALWPKHVELFLPKFNKVYSGSGIVENLFKNHSQIRVNMLQFNLKISATDIRAAILNKKNLKDLVPYSVIKYLKEIKALDRLIVTQNVIKR
ncbi:nicotinamide-nucleotide adenylyltransferase [Patescibacteria group bacterium]|nr:nicotinamide-nucleotide adenylyltransferase [Patescibacteria group bacterium]